MPNIDKSLRENNEEILKYLNQLKEQREELYFLIERQNAEKTKIETEIQRLHYKLTLLTKSLSQRVQALSLYDKTLEDIEIKYKDLKETAHGLLSTVRSETTNLENTLDKKIGTEDTLCLECEHRKYKSLKEDRECPAEFKPCTLNNFKNPSNEYKVFLNHDSDRKTSGDLNNKTDSSNLKRKYMDSLTRNGQTFDYPELLKPEPMSSSPPNRDNLSSEQLRLNRTSRSRENYVTASEPKRNVETESDDSVSEASSDDTAVNTDQIKHDQVDRYYAQANEEKEDDSNDYSGAASSTDNSNFSETYQTTNQNEDKIKYLKYSTEMISVPIRQTSSKHKAIASSSSQLKKNLKSNSSTHGGEKGCKPREKSYDNHSASRNE